MKPLKKKEIQETDAERQSYFDKFKNTIKAIGGNKENLVKIHENSNLHEDSYIEVLKHAYKSMTQTKSLFCAASQGDFNLSVRETPTALELYQHVEINEKTEDRFLTMIKKNSKQYKELFNT